MLRTPSSGGAGTMLGEGRVASWISVIGCAANFGTLVMPGLVPGIHVLRAEWSGVDGRDKPGHDVRDRNHHPSKSGLRGSSTVLTFSSLIAPLAMRSLRSPSVAPVILVR